MTTTWNLARVGRRSRSVRAPHGTHGRRHDRLHRCRPGGGDPRAFTSSVPVERRRVAGRAARPCRAARATGGLGHGRPGRSAWGRRRRPGPLRAAAGQPAGVSRADVRSGAERAGRRAAHHGRAGLAHARPAPRGRGVQPPAAGQPHAGRPPAGGSRRGGVERRRAPDAARRRPRAERRAPQLPDRRRPLEGQHRLPVPGGARCRGGGRRR